MRRSIGLTVAAAGIIAAASIISHYSHRQQLLDTTLSRYYSRLAVTENHYEQIDHFLKNGDIPKAQSLLASSFLHQIEEVE